MQTEPGVNLPIVPTDEEVEIRAAVRADVEAFQARYGHPPGLAVVIVGKDAPSSKAFSWAWGYIKNDVLPVKLEIWHEGRCARCNRKLTVPSSIESGFGPECAGKVGFSASWAGF